MKKFARQFNISSKWFSIISSQLSVRSVTSRWWSLYRGDNHDAVEKADSDNPPGMVYDRFDE